MSTTPKMAPPSIAELTRGYLDRSSAQPSEASDGLFEPYEVSASFRPEPRMAWNEAQVAFALFSTGVSETPIPTGWDGLVQRRDSIAAVACCVGNFPQMLQDMGPLMSIDNLTTLRPSPTSATGGEPKANGTWSELVVRAGVARLEGDFDAADQLLNAAQSGSKGEVADLIANERAALAWHRGKCDEAIKIWSSLPESPAVALNRGMAALFSGKAADAVAPLKAALEGFSTESGWHHLASLYLALAQIRN